MSEKIEYWDCDDNTERLYHETLDEAVEEFLDGQVQGNEPDTLEVYGYARKTVDPKKFKESILESAYEYLSEDFDGEDGHDQNKEIEDAATSFIKTYLDNYSVWICEIVKTEKVNVKEWISKNRPGWSVEAAR